MAVMELVIDIDESIYRHFMNNEYSRADIIAVHTAIVNGRLLPKGHGRLIDADKMKKDDEVNLWLSNDSVRTGKTLKMFSELFIKKIDEQTPIIEADKEE